MKTPRLLAGRRSPNWAFMECFEVPSYDEPESNYMTRLRILQTPWWGVYLHRFDGPDPRETLHDHPWPFVAFVLRGGYRERFARGPHRAGRAPFVTRRHVRWVNVKRATDCHAIVSLDRTPTWTLMFVGRRQRVWGYRDDQTGEWTAFDEHPHAAEFAAAMAARKEMASDGHS